MPPRREFAIRAAEKRDESSILQLLPELANFDLPPQRVPEHLWKGDRELLASCLRGEKPRCFARVAYEDDEAATDLTPLAGFTLVALGDELLSHAPSAHLEAIVVAPWARGRGVATSLMQDAEQEATARGAQSMTLHVFGRNTRARALYAARGYDEELVRCIKWLPDHPTTKRPLKKNP